LCLFYLFYFAIIKREGVGQLYSFIITITTVIITEHTMAHNTVKEPHFAFSVFERDESALKALGAMFIPCRNKDPNSPRKFLGCELFNVRCAHDAWATVNCGAFVEHLRVLRRTLAVIDFSGVTCVLLPRVLFALRHALLGLETLLTALTSPQVGNTCDAWHLAWPDFCVLRRVCEHTASHFFGYSERDHQQSHTTALEASDCATLWLFTLLPLSSVLPLGGIEECMEGLADPLDETTWRRCVRLGWSTISYLRNRRNQKQERDKHLLGGDVSKVLKFTESQLGSLVSQGGHERCFLLQLVITYTNEQINCSLI
jgi:hypothetical protein